ncbi:MAG: hypothetical protein A2342_06080 [Gallionellales bacterium RIFOXYB12_FULL_54_9]|nr:MAG: hypothetical protein A2342_06080 [Gallionellales bacterium RIFOXYB12_FULL_54_9]
MVNNKPGAQLVAEMAAELNEHRYNLERNVSRRTEHLVKRIDLLETCNAKLCGKLAEAQREIGELRMAVSRIGELPRSV